LEYACVAGVWRIRAFATHVSLVLKSGLTSHLFGIKSYPETGEGLFAISLENDNITLSIGTEDEEYLSQRAEFERFLPSRFKNVITPEMIHHCEDGIQIILPPLLKDELIQVHFIVT